MAAPAISTDPATATGQPILPPRWSTPNNSSTSPKEDRGADPDHQRLDSRLAIKQPQARHRGRRHRHRKEPLQPDHPRAGRRQAPPKRGNEGDEDERQRKAKAERREHRYRPRQREQQCRAQRRAHERSRTRRRNEGGERAGPEAPGRHFFAGRTGSSNIRSS